jgi:hypothetical protein
MSGTLRLSPLACPFHQSFGASASTSYAAPRDERNHEHDGTKHDYGNHQAKARATEATLKALKQIRATHDDLKSGSIKKLQNFVHFVEFRIAESPISLSFHA